MIVFICIGTPGVTGDCLGPLVGTLLKEKYKNDNFVEVYGDIQHPIHFNNIEITMKEIEKKYYNDTKIIIDSALGENIGKIYITRDKIILGKGLKKNKAIFGDINIIAIVGKNQRNKKLNWKELQMIQQDYVFQMAREIVESIHV